MAFPRRLPPGACLHPGGKFVREEGTSDQKPADELQNVSHHCGRRKGDF